MGWGRRVGCRQCGLCVATAWVGLGTAVLLAICTATALTCDQKKNMPDDWSWLFDRDTEVQRPPYLSDVLYMGLQSDECLADPVVLRWTSPGPLADAYDDLDEALCVGPRALRGVAGAAAAAGAVVLGLSAWRGARGGPPPSKEIEANLMG